MKNEKWKKYWGAQDVSRLEPLLATVGKMPARLQSDYNLESQNN